MQSVSPQRAMRAVVSAAFAVTGLFAIGCDRAASDRQAMEHVRAGDYQAAAKEKSASPVVAAIATGMAAEDQLASATPLYSELAHNQLQISNSMWTLARTARGASQIADSSLYLAKYNPQPALQTIETTVSQVQGQGQNTWSPTDSGVELPTLQATTARANQLKDQIAEIERNLSSLKQKQSSLMQESIRLNDESEKVKGEQSLALYRQSADARKQASEIGVQVDQASLSLLPLQQELAVVQGQHKIMTDAMEAMVGHRENIEKSWRGITAQAEERANYANSIFRRNGGQERKGLGTISEQATELAALVAQQEKLHSQYEQQLQAASALAKESVSSSEKAIREATPIKTATRGANPIEPFKAAMDPGVARYAQGNIDFTLGTQQASHAALLASRTSASNAVLEIAKELNLQLPEGFDIASINAAKDQAAAQAQENLKSASDTFENVSGASPSAHVRRAANIGQMLASSDMALVASTQGNAAEAKQYADQAKALRDKLAEEGGQLPSLPASLQTGRGSDR